VAPAVLVLMSFVGLVHFDINMLFVALPALAIAVALALLTQAAVRELLLERPMLAVDAEGIFDRRVMAAPVNLPRHLSLLPQPPGAPFP
jgi:hypothetical protein